MRKESILLKIFKALLFCGIFALLVMLYWSTLVVEENLIEIKQKLETIESKTSQAVYKTENPTQVVSKRVYESSLPNLLSPDPYFTKTLPSELPPGFIPNGIRKGASLGKPDSLNPFSNWYQVVTWYGLAVPSLSKNHFGFYEAFGPDLAERIEVKGNPPEYWVYLRDNVYWQPIEKSWFSGELAPQFFKKVKVTAQDFKFYFDAMMNPYNSEGGAVALRTFYDDVEEIKVMDDLTFVVKWKNNRYISKQLTLGLKPIPSHIYKYFPDGSKIIEDEKEDSYRTSSVWALNISKHWAKNIIVSCGAYLFDGFSDRQINFKRNPDHYNPYDALVEGIQIQLRASPDSIWQSFKEGELDNYNIRADQLSELESFLSSNAYKEQPYSVNKLDYIQRSYAYIGWNQARDLFKDKNVRRALTMAIDRERIIRQTLNGMGIPIHGPFFVFSPSNNPNLKPLPFDPIQSRKILEEAGWRDTDRDGILDKNGIPFKFSLHYYVKNPIGKAIAEYMQTALKEVGIEVNLNGVDIADLTQVFEDKNFDALLLAWMLSSPPEDPRQLWHSSQADVKGSSNAIGFRNQEADSIIDKLDFETDPKKRLELYHRFDEIILDEQPYTFLYTPKEKLLTRSYLKNVFLPVDKIPHANISEPDLEVTWIEK